MGLFNNVVCCKDRTAFCDCPSCRINKAGRKKVKLTKEQTGLMLAVLDNYVIECDNRGDKKNIDSPEWLALQRLARDVEAITATIREAGQVT